MADPVTYLRSMDGSEPTDDYGHVGYPQKVSDVLDRTRRGLPVYWPTDPVSVDQRPYFAFAQLRGPNSD